jgi:amino acid transporter
VIAFITWLNVRGIQMVGQAATAMELFIVLPVLVMVVIGIAHWKHNPFVPMVPPHQPFEKVFGLGLALGLWLYSGYEQLSTVAEEVENPQRSYPIALALVVPLSIATYFLPTLAGLAALGNWQDWKTGYFSQAAALIGGPWLGTWMTLAAMVTNLALLNSTVLTSTRMPFAMADDGYMPPLLGRRHPKYGTPWLAILVSAGIYAALALHTLGQLISIYNWLRAATTVLTVLSVWGIRRKFPNLARPFRIPGGSIGLWSVIVLPIVMTFVTLRYSDSFAKKYGVVGLALGLVAYALVWPFRKRAGTISHSD